MTDVRVIVLGNPTAGDDAAALAAAQHIRKPVELVTAGRPGARLLDLLSVDKPTVLVDVTFGLGEPGLITSAKLDELVDQVAVRGQVSSHGFGPAEALRLAQALGRRLPLAMFVGIEGECFDSGSDLSPLVSHGLPAFVAAIDEAVSTMASTWEARDA